MTIKKTLWAIMSLFSISFAIVSWRFVFDYQAFEQVRMAHFPVNFPVATYAHFVLGPVALAVGSFQFIHKLRISMPALHRTIGWIYALTCLSASSAAFLLALNTKSGLMVSFGFGLMATVWFGVTTTALITALTGNYSAHQRWMIRSFTMTFCGGVIFRVVFLGVFSHTFGWDYALCYSIGSWLCWIPGMIGLELWFRYKDKEKISFIAA
mgnify:CR=1 FL=1